MKTVLLPMALVAGLGAASPASASGLIDIRRIPHDPADLREEAGVRSFERRVARAVYRVCHGLVRRPAHEHTAFRNCTDTASSDAREQIDAAARLARASAAR